VAVAVVVERADNLAHRRRSQAAQPARRSRAARQVADLRNRVAQQVTRLLRTRAAVLRNPAAEPAAHRRIQGAALVLDTHLVAVHRADRRSRAPVPAAEPECRNFRRT
jgi:hypothetical protein